MSDDRSQQAVPNEGAASPRLREAEAKLRAELSDYEARDDARIQGEEPPEAGFVIEAAQELLAALSNTRESRTIRTLLNRGELRRKPPAQKYYDDSVSRLAVLRVHAEPESDILTFEAVQVGRGRIMFSAHEPHTQGSYRRTGDGSVIEVKLKRHDVQSIVDQLAAWLDDRCEVCGYQHGEPLVGASIARLRSMAVAHGWLVEDDPDVDEVTFTGGHGVPFGVEVSSKGLVTKVHSAAAADSEASVSL